MSETLKVVDGQVEITNIRHITKKDLEIQIAILEARIAKDQTELDEKKALLAQL
ncbi:MAG: hypothetical protein ACYS1A_16775 [Planctomycetota bacterium]|jgi:hypothetical protein